MDLHFGAGPVAGHAGREHNAGNNGWQLSRMLRSDMFDIQCNEKRLAALLNQIEKAPTLLQLADEGRELPLSALGGLLGRSRVEQYLVHYLDLWHPNCPIMHRPTYYCKETSLPLLASMAFLGAMYSSDESERAAASDLVEYAESYIFSQSPLRDCDELEACFDESPVSAFENLQAGLIIVIARFCAGDPFPRCTATSRRFDSLIKASLVCIVLDDNISDPKNLQAARRMGLFEVRHELEDRITEERWLAKEVRVRSVPLSRWYGWTVAADTGVSEGLSTT